MNLKEEEESLSQQKRTAGDRGGNTQSPNEIKQVIEALRKIQDMQA